MSYVVVVSRYSDCSHEKTCTLTKRRLRRGERYRNELRDSLFRTKLQDELYPHGSIRRTLEKSAKKKKINNEKQNNDRERGNVKRCVADLPRRIYNGNNSSVG